MDGLGTEAQLSILFSKVPRVLLIIPSHHILSVSVLEGVSGVASRTLPLVCSVLEDVSGVANRTLPLVCSVLEDVSGVANRTLPPYSTLFCS